MLERVRFKLRCIIDFMYNSLRNFPRCDLFKRSLKLLFFFIQMLCTSISSILTTFYRALISLAVKVNRIYVYIGKSIVNTWRPVHNLIDCLIYSNNQHTVSSSFSQFIFWKLTKRGIGVRVIIGSSAPLGCCTRWLHGAVHDMKPQKRRLRGTAGAAR